MQQKTIVCTDIAVEDNNSSQANCDVNLASVLIVALVVIIAVWSGIKLPLIAPDESSD